MAHILKYPTKNNKGIIIFTLKEIVYFSKCLKEIRYHFVNRIASKLFPFDKYKPYFSKKLNMTIGFVTTLFNIELKYFLLNL